MVGINWLADLHESVQISRTVIIVDGTITEWNQDEQDNSGGKHQIFEIRVDKVVENENGATVAVGQTLKVSIRFGDADGLPKPIPGIATGAKISLCGAYRKDVYPDRDGDRFSVIHFTHAPIGWVAYKGRQYS